MHSLRSRSKTSPAGTRKLRRPRKIQTPRKLAGSAAIDVYDLELDDDTYTISNQSNEFIEAGVPNDTDAKSWQGLSNSEFKDLGHVSRATSLCCPGADIQEWSS